MSNLRAVIFDMDGVLVDSYRAHLRSWKDTARAFGVELSDDEFARTFGRTSRDIIRTLWPDQFGDDAIARFDAAKEARYRATLEEDFPEMPGASDLIRALHAAGFKLAIGSSGPPENVALVRRKLPAGDLFDGTVNGTEVTRGKPAPDVFLIAAQKLGVEPKHCAVIEDALAGIEAAKRAGMVAIGLTGSTTREALSSRADVVVDSLVELTPESLIQTLK